MNIEMTKSVARRVALVAAASALMEVAAKLPEWIEGMSPASRKAYLKAHPDSKYASQLGGGAKPAATKEAVGTKSIRRPPANSPLGKYIREANERHAKRMDKADEAQERLEKRSAAKTAKPAATKEDVATKPAVLRARRLIEKRQANPISKPAPKGSPLARQIQKGKDDKNAILDKENKVLDKDAATKEAEVTKPIRKAPPKVAPAKRNHDDIMKEQIADVKADVERAKNKIARLKLAISEAGAGTLRAKNLTVKLTDAKEELMGLRTTLNRLLGRGR